MKAIGIIAEYNPFHNGHLYQIQKIKDKYPDYAIVVVMSGNFMQRGDVSIIDKWKRCQIALSNGVDLVIELPFPFATQSADFFAFGAITILEKLKVERVIFGSEGDHLDDLIQIAQCQLENSDFDKLVKIYSKMGNNYPTALSNALEDLTGKRIDSPNDLLGISYVKTIIKNHYKIIPEVIKRTNSYHDSNLQVNISSATAIREAIWNKKSIVGQVPNEEISYFQTIHFLEDYYAILKYKIITDDDLTRYQTVDEGIDLLLKKKVEESQSIEELIQLTKSRRYTYNKIRRMLIHILCNFTKEKAKSFQNISYIRILGFNSLGRKYLNQVKKEVDVPIISKILREKDQMLEFEIQTTKIYDLNHEENCFLNEFAKIIYKEDKYDKE